MERRAVRPRENWQRTAAEHGFSFHTPDGERYWDESHAYRFTLREIEDDLEDPAEELEQMCFEVVERAVANEELLRRLAIPEMFWGYVADSWGNRERNLYGRMDFCYDGQGPAKLYEYNADTPTSLYESAIFQWVWLEQAMEQGLIPEGSDQFNSLHERLVDAFGRFGVEGPLHLACARDTDEDLGTIEYLEDCARQAGLATQRMFIEDIGVAEDGRFTDLDDRPIRWLFKLYPWEWLMEEEFGSRIPRSDTRFIEPGWKAVLSNKGLLALLWEMFEGHPNLLPTYFEGGPGAEGARRALCPQAAPFPGGSEHRPRGERPDGDGPRGALWRGGIRAPGICAAAVLRRPAADVRRLAGGERGGRHVHSRGRGRRHHRRRLFRPAFHLRLTRAGRRRTSLENQPRREPEVTGLIGRFDTALLPRAAWCAR